MGLALAVVTFLTFAPTLRHDFIAFDDVDWVVKNPDFNPPRFEAYGRSWTEAYPDLYTPMLWTVWGWLAHVGRSQTPSGVVWTAGPYHAFNLAAHVAASLMALLVLRRLTLCDWAALAGAAVFALHPVQAESVAWVSGMKTPLSGLFALWATWHFLCYSDSFEPADARNPHRRRWLHYALGTLAFVLALISKPTVVVLPIVIAMIVWLLRGRRLKPLLISLAPWFALALACGLINKGAQPAPTVFRPALWERVLVALDSIGFYAAKLVVPYPLLPDYSRTPEALVHAGWARPEWIVALGLLAFAVAVWRRKPWVTVAVGIFVLGALTTLGLIPYDYQAYTTVADRYIYLSMLGPAIAAAYLVPRSEGVATASQRPRWRVAVASVVIAGCAVLTFVQCLHWHDTGTLFHYTLRHNPRSLAAYRGLALDAFDHGRPDETLQVAKQGLAARPGDSVLLQWVGTIYFTRGQLDEALAAFAEGAKTGSNRSQNLNGMGQVLAEMRRPQEARAALEASIREMPRNAIAHENLGILFGRMREWDRCIAELDLALQLDPTLLRARPAREAAIQYRQRAIAAGTWPSPATAPAGQHGSNGK